MSVVKFRAVLLTSVVLFVIALAPVSVSQTPNQIQMKPRIIPPVHTGILQDPSGTYVFYNVTSTSYIMNLTSYEALLHDPYTTNPGGAASVLGDMVLLSTTNRPSPPHWPIAYGEIWAGVGGGDCTSMTVSGGLVCNGSKGTLGTSEVTSSALSWTSSCYSGTTCATSLWTGLSPQDSSNTPLIQAGMDVCVNDLADCSFGTHNGQSGAQSWEAWDECLASPDHTVWTPTNPTKINGVAYEFYFVFIQSEAKPTFQWTVGSWNYYYTDYTPNCLQTDFQQSEGIMEQYTHPLNPQEMVVFSPNPNVMTGYWETGNWCGCTYQNGYLGNSYTIGLYYLTSNGQSGGNLIAYGGPWSSTQFYFGIL